MMFPTLLASVASLSGFVGAQHLFDRNLAYSSPFTNAPHVGTPYIFSLMFEFMSLPSCRTILVYCMLVT